jgi:hypothetical protein
MYNHFKINNCMKYAILVFLTLSSCELFAQFSNFNTQKNWTLNKKEIIFGAGGTQFLGDLGGRDDIGKNYSLADMNFEATGVSLMGGYRYRFHQYFSTSTVLHMGVVRGDDTYTQEFARSLRNIHFRSPIVELSQRLEVIVLAKEKVGKRYDMPGLKGMKDVNTQIYVYAGLGATYFNPQSRYIDGTWTSLRPLNTEGQNLPGGPKRYLPVTVVHPFGIGFRFGLSRLWRVSIEATYIKTYTDYMDDTSGFYYDNSVIESQMGPVAAFFANPSAAEKPPGDIRGNPTDKDAYFYLNAVFARNITYKNYERSKSTKWKGARAKF